MRISHEAIYQTLYILGRGALKRELVSYLRTGRALRTPRARSQPKAWAHVSEEVMISSRPAEVEDHAVPGHWEGVLIIGIQARARCRCGLTGRMVVGERAPRRRPR